MKIPADQWPTVSRLLDEALDLDAGARPAWLDALARREPAVSALVQRLLAAHADRETADVLATGPHLNLTAPMAAAAAHALAVSDRVGPYRLLRELGAGGMAQVWLARRDDGAFVREVALKIPQLSRLRRDLALRFAQERDILARLEHPHIARFYDAGVAADGLPYLAMEYVDGQPITTWCDRQRLPLSQRIALFRQVLDAVQFAHGSLVIHRDLKPSNILVTADGQVRLLDFGIARLLADSEGDSSDSALTQLGGRALTPDYASPEQIRGDALTIASDQYALGVLLYELLAGQRPYTLALQSVAQLEQAIVAAEVLPPSRRVVEAAAVARSLTPTQLARQLSGDLDAIVLKALARTPADRYATLAALADDLDRQRDGLPVRAKPPSRGYRLRKFIGRNRLPVTAASAAVLALVAGASVALWQAHVAREQADVAQRESRALSIVGNFMLEAFSKIASDPQVAQGEGRAAMAQALQTALKRQEDLHSTDPKGLAAMYGHGASLFNYLQHNSDALHAANKELDYLKLANERPVAIAVAHRQIALAHYRGRNPTAAFAQLDAALAVLGADRAADARRTRADVLRLKARLHIDGQQLRQSEQALTAARAELEHDHAGSERAYGSVLVELARARSTLGDDADAERLLARVRELYQRHPQRESEWGGLELVDGLVALNQGRYADAVAAGRRASDLFGKEFGATGPNAATVELFTVMAQRMQGDYADAEAAVLRILQVLGAERDFDHSFLSVRSRVTLAEVYLDWGRLERAESMLDSISAELLTRHQFTLRASMVRAQLLSGRGRHTEALAVLAAGAAASPAAMSEAIRMQRQVALVDARIRLRQGDLEGARQKVAAATPNAMPGAAQPAVDPAWLAAADLRAEIALAVSAHDEALRHYESTLGEEAESRRGPLAAGKARLAYGRALSAAGRQDDARAQWRRAAELLAQQHAESPLRATVLTLAR